jgi:hypothetical protein
MAVGLVAQLIPPIVVQMVGLGEVLVLVIKEQELAAQATHPPHLHHKVMTEEMVLQPRKETEAVVAVLMQMVGMQQERLLRAMVEPD